MTKPLSKESLVRSAWITELRRQGHRKCEGAYQRGISVCALGLLIEVAGVPDGPCLDDVSGLTWPRKSEIVAMNDGEGGFHKHTFSEIADVVEGWFKD